MGRGGRSGGFGGGGSRGGSFGGSRGGSFGGGGFSGRRSYGGGHRPSYNRGFSGGRGFGGMFFPGPIIINNNSGSPGRNTGPSGGSTNNKNGNSVGCLHTIVLTIAVFAFIILMYNTFIFVLNAGNKKEPLKANVSVTEYYTDELGWINNPSVFEKGLKYFYEKTGVQPYVYITDNVGELSQSDLDSKIEEFANDKYNQLFSDEAHLLLIFYENNSYYRTYCLAGSSANTVIDASARDILLSKIDKYYYMSYDDNEFFSIAFEKAADDIMKSSSKEITYIIISIVVLLICLGIEFAVKYKEKEEKKKKEIEDLLSKPLETFGNDKAEELAKKYETDTEKEDKTSEKKE